MNTQAPKCYSYCRYSSDLQSKGHSLQRQIEASKKWANNKGFELDESIITDLGISGYSKTSNNISKGALGKFLDQVHEGKIPPNSILIVESLDRISRRAVLDAFEIFRKILKNKIKIVTLMDGQEYDEDSLNQNPFQLMGSLGIMARAFDESETKSQRVSAAWEKKREKAIKTPLTAKCPMWLKLNKIKKKFDPIPDNVKIVERIFKMSADGYGYQQIIKTLNDENIPSFRGKSWGQTTIRNILHGRAVLGEFTPHRKQDGIRIPLEPIPNYFPQVIPYQLYQKVHDRYTNMDSSRGGGKNGAIRNLFGLIGRCGYCNGTMRFINKGSSPKGGQYLVCNDSCLRNKSDCFKVFWNYNEIETAFLKFSNELSSIDILDHEAKTNNEKRLKFLQSEIDILEETKAKKERNYEIGDKNLTELVQNNLELSENKIVINQIKKLGKITDEIKAIDDEIQKKKSEIQQIKNEESVIQDQLFSMQELIKHVSYINNDIDPNIISLRFKLRNEIRNIVEKIYFLPGGNIIPKELANSFQQKEFAQYKNDNPKATGRELEKKKEILSKTIQQFQVPDLENRFYLVIFRSGVIKALKFNNKTGNIELLADQNFGSRIRDTFGNVFESNIDQWEMVKDIIENSLKETVWK